MEVFTVAGEVRDNLGKKGATDTRRAGRIPCILYGGDSNVAFSTTFKELKDLIYTPDFRLADIQVDGQSYRAIVKEVQFHPLTDEVVHVDFLRLIEKRPVKVEIPIRFKGNSPGVKAGGKLIQLVRRVKIKTTPENLVDEVVLDISELELGQSIRIRDIEVNENIEILNSPGIPVGMIEIPRALRSATAAKEKAEQ